MGQTCPGAGNYKLILNEYEKQLRKAEKEGNQKEISHWRVTIDGLRTEAASRGIKI